ncbi:MAG: helix-turn-helix transcriptional regulator [Desulfovibrio sp.]
MPCLSSYQVLNRCLTDHLINLSAIYESAVEYEQRMRNRPPSKFGAALIQEYKKRGFTQYSLAKKLERSTRYLNNLEHDRSEPRFTTILLLADAIGMEPGELVNAAAELSWAALDGEGAISDKANEEKETKKKPKDKKSKKK